MTAAGFRRLALRLPEAVESAHMQHPDFRVRGKIFATLHADGTHGVVMLTPRHQAEFVRSAPEAFTPSKGVWGLRGCTEILLKAVTVAALTSALSLAWTNKAPKKLAVAFLRSSGR